jgi:hypothetical protein
MIKFWYGSQKVGRSEVRQTVAVVDKRWLW